MTGADTNSPVGSYVITNSASGLRCGELRDQLHERSVECDECVADSECEQHEQGVRTDTDLCRNRIYSERIGEHRLRKQCDLEQCRNARDRNGGIVCDHRDELRWGIQA